MTVTPIKDYRSPRYPDKQTALRDPLLLKSLPRRWAGKAAVVTALSATAAMMLTGCKSNPGIAPVFEYGIGYGYGYKPIPAGFMGEVMGPTTYLSEDEAYSLIIMVLEQEGLDCTHTDKTIETKLPRIVGFQKGTDIEYQDGSITLDGFDPARNIGFEFISEDDSTNLYFDNNDGNLDVKETAKAIRNGLAKQDSDTVIGVFYDPVDDPGQNLILQVKDFIAWLKAEEII